LIHINAPACALMNHHGGGSKKNIEYKEQAVVFLRFFPHSTVDKVATELRLLPAAEMLFV